MLTVLFWVDWVGGDPTDDGATEVSVWLSLHMLVYGQMRSIGAVLTGFGFGFGLVENPSLG